MRYANAHIHAEGDEGQVDVLWIYDVQWTCPNHSANDGCLNGKVWAILICIFVSIHFSLHHNRAPVVRKIQIGNSKKKKMKHSTTLIHMLVPACIWVTMEFFFPASRCHPKRGEKDILSVYIIFFLSSIRRDARSAGRDMQTLGTKLSIWIFVSAQRARQPNAFIPISGYELKNRIETG